MKRSLNALSLAGLFFLACAAIPGPSQAQNWQSREGWMECRDRIQAAERRLEWMSERFGWRSPQAQEARFDLERIRDYCRQMWGGRHDWDRPHH